MAAAGDQVRVVSLGSLPSGEQAALVNRLRRAQIPVHSLQADSVWDYARAFRSLRDDLADRSPDLVQTFLHHANVLGMHAATSAGIKSRVAGVRVAQPKFARSLLERRALRRAHSVVCVSRQVAHFAHNKLGCSAEATVVIPNGVDVDSFASAEPASWSQLGWPEDAQVCLFLGRLDRQKGIELLQRQIDRLAPPQSLRKLLLVGDGPLRHNVQAWCGRLGPDRVQRLPWQPDVAPWLRACRLLVLPSHYEGMPNVVLEAMAAAKPVVCSRVEGSEELLSRSPEAQSFAPGDEAQMVRLIERFQSDETLCQVIGEQNQALVRSDYSLTAMTQAYREHYRALLTRRLEVN
jgi:glycosyltransferase involved in cell wall biosynthesis